MGTTIEDDALLFVEHFEDVEALEAHTETPHYEAFMDELASFVDGEMETEQFQVAESWDRTFGLEKLRAGEA